MRVYPFVMLILGAIALVLFLINRDRSGSVKALLYKTLTSFFFIAVACASYFSNANPNTAGFTMLIMMGLVCGLIGDVVLDLKIMYPESSSLYQHGGMISFFIGHLFYLAALIKYFGFSLIPLEIALGLAVVMVGVSTFVLKYDFKEHSIDSYLYSLVLSYMMTQACYSAISRNYSVDTVLLAAGSVLFVLSDLILLKTYYENKDSRPFIIANHVLYYGAQFLIALSVLYVVL